MLFKYNRELYDKNALLKAAYNFTDKAYFHLDVDDKYYLVEIEMKIKNNSLTEKDFENEILAQMVRKNIREKTKNIREILLARALSSTIIQNEDVSVDEEQPEGEKTMDITDILQDWFDKYE